MEIGLLGPVTVDRDGTVFRLGHRDRVVLAALALHPGALVTAERLADALWAAEPPASWAKVIQGCVVRLRKALGTDVIETTSGGYRLVVADDVVDTSRFETLLRQGREHARAGRHHRTIRALTDALALWRGRPLIEVEEWEPAQQEAARLDEQQ